MLYSPDKPPLSPEETLRSERLYISAERGCLPRMRTLLQHDTVGVADCHQGNSRGPISTTLTVYLAACRKEKEQALLETKSLVEEETVCMRNEEKTLVGTKLLVQHGADVSTELLYGLTAMRYAVSFDLVEVVRFLIENNGKIEFYHLKSVEMTRLFIENGFDIRSRSPGPHGETLLHSARGHGTNFSKLRHFLVVEGCDIDALNNWGETALHIAARYGSTECLTQLCHMGARLDIRNYQGKTPLDEAVFVWTRQVFGENEHHVSEISERKKILEEEPGRRAAIDYLCFRISDCEYRSESRVFKEENSRSNLLHLDPEIHRLIMKECGKIPLKR
jgi:hypothetical protein